MVIEHYQTDEKEECEHRKTKTHQNELESLSLIPNTHISHPYIWLKSKCPFIWTSYGRQDVYCGSHLPNTLFLRI